MKNSRTAAVVIAGLMLFVVIVISVWIFTAPHYIGGQEFVFTGLDNCPSEVVDLSEHNPMP